MEDVLFEIAWSPLTYVICLIVFSVCSQPKARPQLWARACRLLVIVIACAAFSLMLYGLHEKAEEGQKRAESMTTQEKEARLLPSYLLKAALLEPAFAAFLITNQHVVFVFFS